MSRTEWGAGERLADRAEITDQMYRYARAARFYDAFHIARPGVSFRHRLGNGKPKPAPS